MNIDALLTAFGLADIEGLVTPVADTDKQLGRDLAPLLTAANGDGPQENLADELGELLGNIGGLLGGGDDPVATFLQVHGAGLTYAGLIRDMAGISGLARFRPSAEAAPAAPDIMQAFADAGEPWSDPDTAVPDLSSPAPLVGTHDGGDRAEPTVAAPGWRPKLSTELKAFLDSQLKKWPKELGDLGSSKESGNLIHLVIQAHYIAWALQQKPPHTKIMIDNRIVDELTPPALPLDRAALRDWFRRLIPLWHIVDGDPYWETFGNAVQGLTSGADWRSWARPDIVDLDSHEIYEIKPVSQAEIGMEEVLWYAGQMNAVQFGTSALSQVLGSWTLPGGFSPPTGFVVPGVQFRSFMPFPLPDGSVVFYGLLGPGLIVYQITRFQDWVNSLAAVQAAGKVIEWIAAKARATGRTVEEVFDGIAEGIRRGPSPVVQKMLIALLAIWVAINCIPQYD